MEAKQKLLLFDVDGTLVSYDGVVPESCVKSIQKARENGHIVFVVTGRTANRATVGGIEVDGMICGNGAYVAYHDKVLRDLSLSLAQTAEITDYLDARHLDYFMEGNEGLYGSGRFEVNAIPTYEKYGLKNPNIRALYPMMTFPESMHQDKVIKINYILHSYQDYLDFKEKFGSAYQCLTWGGKGEDALFGDCALPGIDKQRAIDLVIRYLNVEKENIYAFGDAEVDIPMFEAAGTAVCVGSGRDAAKQSADYVTDDVKKDGISKALLHFHLIEKEAASHAIYHSPQ